MKLTRRGLMQAGAISAAFAGLGVFASSCAKRKTPDLTTDVYGKLIKDPNGILDLPKGFDYKVISRQGDEMTDGLLVPGDPDGMAAYAGEDGATILMRNHELSPKDFLRELPPLDQSISPFGKGDKLVDKIDQSRIYDHTKDGRPMAGGVTGLVVDPGPLTVQKQWLALVGTDNNCAGGPTPWGSWISCEETTSRAGEDGNKNHGYAFEVVANPALGLQEPVPLKAMGRFQHEAAGVDPDTGIVYMTQDDFGKASLLYRFLPKEPGKLHKGGKLQALAIKGQPSRDLRNWPTSKGERVPTGSWLEVEWVDLHDVDSPDNDIQDRGVKDGAAIFTRGEGAWWGDKELFFTCTDGGAAKCGQIFRYVPSQYEGTEFENKTPGRLQLFVESPGRGVLDFCDNLTVAPWGDLMVCEDEYSDGDGVNYMRGITRDGKVYNFARCALKKKNEFTGVCFGPDKKTLYFNFQQDGLTIAVRGPWHDLA